MFFQYLFLKLKKNFITLPLSLLITAALLAVLFLFGSTALMRSRDENAVRKVRAVIVGDFESSPYLSLGVTALQNFDSSRFEVEIVIMTDEEEAKQALREGKADFYAVIPEGFEDAVGYYRNDRPIRYVSTNGAASVGTLLMDEIAADISREVQETQNAIYGMQCYAYEHGFPGDISWRGEELAGVYGISILTRQNLFEVTELANRIPSLTMNMLAGTMMLFLMLTGISRAPLQGKDRTGLSVLLARKGLPDFLQFFCDAVSDFLLTAFLALPLFLLLYAVRKPAGLYIAEINGMGLYELTGIFFRMMPVFFLFSAVQMFLFESVHGIFENISLTFVLSLVTAFFSGCLYPVSWFPEEVQPVLRSLPPGLAAKYTAQLFLGRPGSGTAFAVFLTGVSFLALALAVREAKRRAAL